MGLSRVDFWRDRDCRFWKLCGSGSGQGFTPIPNTKVWAILACWPDIETAQDRIRKAGVYKRWARRATESWTLFLNPTSARGSWSGRTPFIPSETPDGPVAALTRGTIRARHLAQFWRAEPAISARIGVNPDVLFKIGIGEMPWLHQVTFSVWPDTASMARFARTSGAHAEAIRQVREGGWFAEELYARFHVAGEAGAWRDAPPLSTRPEAA